MTAIVTQARRFARRQLKQRLNQAHFRRARGLHVNLCSGDVVLPGFCNVDVARKSDLILDLERRLLPFADASCERVVCISAINYFTRQRALEIIQDVHRVLVPGGCARFGTQDLKLIARKFADGDQSFFFEKDRDGRDRFEGETMGDKFNSWFYGYRVYGTKYCKYVYDYETLALLFRKAGFTAVEQKGFLESRMPDVAQIDNRPEQMFFLEATK
jgi:predicted SAM-dependent methyltransferase